MVKINEVEVSEALYTDAIIVRFKVNSIPCKVFLDGHLMLNRKTFARSLTNEILSCVDEAINA